MEFRLEAVMFALFLFLVAIIAIIIERYCMKYFINRSSKKKEEEGDA